jgi:hypothetical protein
MSMVGKDLRSYDSDWDAATLRAACWLLARAPAGQVMRVCLEGRAPRRTGGALTVLRLAKRLAEEHGLRAGLTLWSGRMTLTFVRRSADSAAVE